MKIIMSGLTRLKIVLLDEENNNHPRVILEDECDESEDPHFKMNSRQMEYYQKCLDICKEKGWLMISSYYVNSQHKLKAHCAGNHIMRKTYSELRRYHCRDCIGFTPESCAAEIEQICKERGWIMKSPYVKYNVKIDIECDKGHSLSLSPQSIKSRGCKICSKRCNQSAAEEFNHIMTTEGYEIIEPYKSGNEYVVVKCPAKGHTWRTRPDIIKKGARCVHCHGTSPEEGFKNLVDSLDDRGYVLKSPYKNARTKVTIECLNGHLWEVLPSHITTYNCSCPNCPSNESKLERHTREYLESIGLKITCEYEIDHPKLKTRRYDFYFNYEDKNYLVEIDGPQHFEYSTFMYASHQDFLDRQHVDKVKTFTALSLGYKVIRIDYTQVSYIVTHIRNAFDSSENLYLSKPEMYQYLY